jgi:hypothetical protein
MKWNVHSLSNCITVRSLYDLKQQYKIHTQKNNLLASQHFVDTYLSTFVYSWLETEQFLIASSKYKNHVLDLKPSQEVLQHMVMSPLLARHGNTVKQQGNSLKLMFGSE